MTQPAEENVQKETFGIEIVILILMLLVNTIFILISVGVYWGLTKLTTKIPYYHMVSLGIALVIYLVTIIRFAVDRSGWDSQISQWIINQQKQTTGVVY